MHKDDGLDLKRTYVTATIRCAPPDNRPLPQERVNCISYLMREIEILKSVRVVVSLGGIAFDGYLSARRKMGSHIPTPNPLFRRGAIYSLADGTFLVASYHPSQHNTLTGMLTREMFEGGFPQVRILVDAIRRVDQS